MKLTSKNQLTKELYVIRQTHFNHSLAKKYKLNLSDGAYVDYLVKLTLAKKLDKITVNRGETVERLPLIFNRVDTVYRANKRLEKKGVLEIIRLGGTDVLKVNSSIVNHWLEDLDTEQVLSSFKEDLGIALAGK